MTYEATLNEFWNGFGIPAYPTDNVPSDAKLPYMTYETVYPSYDSQAYGVVNIYNRGDRLTAINKKARQIRDYISRGGVQIPYENGTIWIQKGSPEQVNPVTDNNIKHRMLNITYTLNVKEI